MRIEDFKAIQDFDTSKNKYLAVKKNKNGQEHLEVKKRSVLGRIWMKLGLSSSSLEKVSDYIRNNINTDDFEYIKENKNSLMKLNDKLFNYLNNRGFRAQEAVLDAQNITNSITYDTWTLYNLKIIYLIYHAEAKLSSKFRSS